MRDKFTELIEQGVAKFGYTKIAPEIPEQDPICRFYNNIWSIPSDTHMHYNNETGERYITGHMVGIQDKWDKFVNASNWGAVNFRTSGFWCLNHFLQSNGLTGTYSALNSDTIFLVIPCDGVDCPNPGCPACCTTTESQIPQNIGILTIDGNVMKIKECYHGKESIYDVCNAMNESIYVRGNEWTVSGDKLVCPIGNKIIIL